MQAPFKEGGSPKDIGVWRDFSPIVRAITPKVPFCMTEGGRPIVGAYGEQVPYEAWRRNEAEEDIYGRMAYHKGYVRVGNLAFVDSRLKLDIPRTVQETLRDSIIWLSRFRTEMGEATHTNYSAITIQALASIDLRGRHILDLGSGDGALALTAHRLGASRVTLVDDAEQYQHLFQDHLTVNETAADSFSFIDGDITKPETIIPSLPNPVDVVVANIGPTYGDVHLAAIDLLDYLPTVKTYVGGAYIKGYKEMDPAEALERLKQKGFAANFREVIVRMWCQTFMVDKQPPQ